MNLPEGWPTEEMLNAGHKAYWGQKDGVLGVGSYDRRMKEAFIAMLAAAPTPPAQKDAPVAYEIYDATRKPCSWISVSKEKYLELTSIGWNGRTLYTRPADGKLRKAAEELFDVVEELFGDFGHLDFQEKMEKLRAALEGK